MSQDRATRQREAKRKYREANRDKIQEHNRKHYQENRDEPEYMAKKRESSNKYLEANRDAVTARQRETWLRRTPEQKAKAREARRKYREANRDKLREQTHRHLEENRVVINARKRELRQTPKYKAKEKEAQRKWREANRDRARHWNRKGQLKKYGLTPEEHTKLFDKQGRCCAICQSKTSNGYRGAFSTDHCHTTQKVRGILCSTCNLLLGYADDSIERLQAAIDYLAFHGVVRGE